MTLAVLKLRDEGKLSLDDPAERYVPELKTVRYPTSDSPRITIRYLLTHSEGFPQDNPWDQQLLAESEEEFSRMMRSGIPFSNVPGVTYEYSNYGFAILGRIVSQVSGVSYEESVSRSILQPLGMSPRLSIRRKCRRQPRDRLSVGRRAMEGGAGARAWIVWRHGWDAHDDPRSQQAPGCVSRRVAAAGRTRDGSRAPRTRVPDGRHGCCISRSDAVLDKSTNASHLTATSYRYGLSVTRTCQFRMAVAHGGGLPG